MNGLKKDFKLYPEYKSSGIEWMRDIPEEWTSHKLKFVSRIITGNTPSKKEEINYVNGDFPWVKPDELNNSEPIIITNEKLSKIGLSKARCVPEKTTLVCCIGSVGNVGISGVKLATNQQINSIIFNNKVNGKYGFYVLTAMKGEHLKHSNIVVTPILNKTKQSNLFIPLPLSYEQHAIANFLDRETALIDTIIKKQQKLIELLQEKRSVLMTHAVTKGLNPNVKMKPSGVEWIREVPEVWEVRKVKFTAPICKVKIKNSDYKIALENIESYTGRYIETETAFEGEGIAFDNKSILYGKLRPYLCKVFIPGRKGSCVSEFLVMKPDINLSSKKFLYYYFTSFLFTDVINGASFGAKMPRADWKIVGNFKFFLPPLPKQEDIAGFLDQESEKINNLISKIEKQISLLCEYKQSLIIAAVTGKIDVRDEHYA